MKLQTDDAESGVSPPEVRHGAINPDQLIGVVDGRIKAARCGGVLRGFS
jgi:hypothetical protein